MFLGLLLLPCVGFLTPTVQSHLDSYDSAVDLYRTRVKNGSYSPLVRPCLNQSEPTTIYVSFSIQSIVEINDVTQAFTCNGFVNFYWMDQKITWSPAEFDGIRILYPKVSDIWKPGVYLLNTLDKMDPFEEMMSPIRIFHSGLVVWSLGGLLSVSCSMDLTKFPFDQQECTLQLASLASHDREVTFEPSETAVMKDFIPNGQWEVVGSRLASYSIEAGQYDLPGATITFILKRRPTYFMITVMLPTMFMSVLNPLVFIIPVESGEKISFGISVLVAQSVFMTLLSDLLPQSTLTLPRVTVYAFTLLVLATSTVLISSIVAFLYHLDDATAKDSPETQGKSVSDSLPETARTTSGNKRRNNRVSILPSKSCPAASAVDGGNHHPPPRKFGEQTSKWRTWSRKINNAAFVESVLTWIMTTMVFLIETLDL